jgi:hypothetical protein
MLPDANKGISIAEFKTMLGEFADKLSDEQISWLYNVEYQITDAIFDRWIHERNKKVAGST